MNNTIIAVDNEKILKKLNKKINNNIKNILYREAILEILKKNKQIKTIIISKELPGEISFEDTIRNKEVKPITEDWLVERKNKNQRNMSSLINTGKIKVNNNSYLDYNNVVDLEKHNKLARLIFYMLYDRPTFKRRIREILKKGR